MELTEAIEAAAKATYLEFDSHAGPPEFIRWEAMIAEDPVIGHLYRETALLPLAVATPYIEAQSLRSAAQALPKSDLAFRVWLIARAERIERDLP
jgi:hypothetical protein